MVTASFTPVDDGSDALIGTVVVVGLFLLFFIVVATIITICVLIGCLIKRKRNVGVATTELTDGLDNFMKLIKNF